MSQSEDQEEPPLDAEILCLFVPWSCWICSASGRGLGWQDQVPWRCCGSEILGHVAKNSSLSPTQLVWEQLMPQLLFGMPFLGLSFVQVSGGSWLGWAGLVAGGVWGVGSSLGRSPQGEPGGTCESWD